MKELTEYAVFACILVVMVCALAKGWVDVFNAGGRDD